MRQPYSFISLKTSIFTFTCLVLLAMAGGTSSGQLSYSFAASNGSFGQITGTTTTLTGTVNEGAYNNIPIGFTFKYNDIDYTTVSASTNGWMTFGQPITSYAFANSLTSGGTRPLVAPLWDNLTMITATDFTYELSGTIPNRVFTAQWMNVKWQRSAAYEVISFQVKLYETTGKIQFIYLQNIEPVSSGSASIGIAATATGPDNFLSLTSTAPTATVSSTLENAALGTKPQSGQVFEFSPSGGPEIVISSQDPAINAGTMIQNTYDNVIYSFGISVAQSAATLTGLQVITTGTYTEPDLQILQAYYSEDANFSPVIDELVGYSETSLGPGLHIFDGFSLVEIPAGSTGYIFITTDLFCTSTSGATISVDEVTTEDLTFLSGTPTGSTFPGAAQTIIDATPVNVTSPSAAASGTTAALTWISPAGCYDDVMIVGKAGTSITASPSGNDYTGDLVFGGSGTPFDGGFVLYKGRTSPQTITGLAEGITYYFKFFTRKGTIWSSGVETSVTIIPVTTGDFRSLTTGDWGNTLTWQYFNGSTWVAAAGTPSSVSANITIRNGHTVTVTASASADQLTINFGGTLKINSGITFTIPDGAGTDCIVDGTLNNTGTISRTGTLVFNGTGVYIHSGNAGTIPTATWNTNSTCRITGSTNNPPSGRNQAFYNFIWDCASQGNSGFNLAGTPSIVNGTFSVINTGASNITPGGDVTYAAYVQTGGIFNILNNTTPRSVNVINFTMQGGTLDMSSSDGTTGTLNVSGNFSFTGGTITESRNNRGLIVFNGSGSAQIYTSTSDFTNQIDITVNPGAYLQMATDVTVIRGTGIFTLSANATLGITSTNGIASSGISGNIQTTTRIFDPGAHYLYNRAGSQFTGNGLPAAAITGSVTVATGTTIETTGSIIVNGSLVVNGTLLPGAENQTFSGTGTLSGTGRAKVTRVSQSPEFLHQYPIANRSISNLTVEYFVPGGGQIISPVTYGNLILSNTTGENILYGTANVSGTLTTAAGLLTIDPTGFLTAATLISGGSITLAASGRATIGSFVNNGTVSLRSTAPSENFSMMIDSYSGTGEANAEMYLTGGGPEEAPKWHYVAVPMNYSNTNVFTDINIWNLMRYDDSFVLDQSTSTAMDEGFVWWDNYDNKGGFTSLQTGRGYAFYHSEDVTTYFTGLSSLETSIGSLPLQWSGANRLYPQYYGYNILGNSLTCSLDWDLVTETGDVDDAVYYLVDYDIASYLRPAGGINGGTKDIPPLQGFMVKANGPGASLDFTNAREHSTQVRYKKSALRKEDAKSEAANEKMQEIVPLVKLGLTKISNEDETLVWFSEDATNGVEGDHDAQKLSFETGSDLYTMSGSTKLGINGLPMPETETIVPVIVSLKTQSADYKIVANQIQGLENFKVTLTDKYNGNMVTDLRSNPEYSFTSNPGVYTDRFVLKFTNIATSVENDVVITDKPFNIYGFNNTIYIKLLDNSMDGRKWTVNIFDVTGNKIFTENQTEFFYGDIKQYSQNFRKGIFIVELSTENKRITSKVHLF